MLNIKKKKEQKKGDFVIFEASAKMTFNTNIYNFALQRIESHSFIV